MIVYDKGDMFLPETGIETLISNNNNHYHFYCYYYHHYYL